MTEVVGVVVEFCHDALAAYKALGDGDSFWLPASLFVTLPDEAPARDQGQFGQIGGDFYVKLSDGNREHVQTAF